MHLAQFGQFPDQALRGEEGQDAKAQSHKIGLAR